MQKIQKQELRIPLINIPITYGAQEKWSLSQSLCTLILKECSSSHCREKLFSFRFIIRTS